MTTSRPCSCEKSPRQAPPKPPVMTELISPKELYSHANYRDAIAVVDGLDRSNTRADRAPNLQALLDPEDDYREFQTQWSWKPGIPIPLILKELGQKSGEEVVSAILKQTQHFVQTARLEAIPDPRPVDISRPSDVAQKCWDSILPAVSREALIHLPLTIESR